ncbi:MAG: tRNA pseudouridine(38-40) synthase TruA [Christensenellaceae bacterium]|nr:tRNA pseudouridine(38-40) synthase TruA [Christensenellaceae bacterium]
MKKICLKITYDGTNYSGWQRQENAVSVQQIIENSIEKLTKSKTSIVGASRTDAGVHAFDQTACFETSSNIPADKFALALNTILPDDIRIKTSYEVPNDFHPIKSSKFKTYQYKIFNEQYSSAIYRNISYHVPYKLNINAMNDAAQILIGIHDFKAFQAAGSSAKTSIRTIYSSKVECKDCFIIYSVKGDGFLYNMVRIIVGTLVEIGKGKLKTENIEKALKSGNRIDLGPTAPAKGLILLKIDY